MRVEVKPELLRWAQERAGFAADSLTRKFPRLGAWEGGQAAPTLKQLERFARATRTPVGYFFLPAPPVERLPIPDFRTVGSEPLRRPSPDLLETVYLCQQRQEGYRDHARATREPRRDFVGSATVDSDIVATAEAMRATLGLDLAERRLVAHADAAGVLVMTSGIVGSNTHRPLDPDEFRGFALADDLAPLVFINGADSKSAQMFTLAHELAHLWLGQSALSDATAERTPSHKVERWCNQVAAEVLVPLGAFRREHGGRKWEGVELVDELKRLARIFKVSTLVVLRRMHDAGGLSWDELWQRYPEELERLRILASQRKKDGGDFHRVLPVRVSPRLARALVESTLEGRTSFTEALRLLGFKKMQTFHDLGHRLGVT